jgi:hypothetical protein
MVFVLADGESVLIHDNWNSSTWNREPFWQSPDSEAYLGPSFSMPIHADPHPMVPSRAP